MTTEIITSIDLSADISTEQTVQPPADTIICDQITRINDKILNLETPAAKSAFLRRVADMLTQGGGKNLGSNPVFSHDLQELDGFRLGFMEPALFLQLCKEFDLDPEISEAILMQTDQPTEPHVHLQGDSVFLPLGAEHGFPHSSGGTYLGEYDLSAEFFMLDYVAAHPGQPFEVSPGTIHFFAPDKGACFTAIAFVQPRIKDANGGFDIKRFSAPKVCQHGQKAFISLAS